MIPTDPNVISTHLAQGLRERAADVGDEDRFYRQVYAAIATVPQRHWPARLGRRTGLVLVAAALLGLVAGSLAVGGFLRQRSAPLGGLIAVAADARAGAGFEIPLDPMKVEYGPGPTDIFVIGRGMAPRPLFPVPGADVVRACPAYSPDGLRFVHLEVSGDGDAKYVISRLDASGLPATTESVVTPPTSTDSGPSCAKWSSDGRSLAYVAPDAIGQMELHVRDIDGGEVILNPTPNTTTSGGFAWSPVARTIAYVDDGLFIVPVDGSQPRHLMVSKDEETIDWVTWVPDGSAIDVGVSLYDIVRAENGFTGSQTGTEIRRMRLDGTVEMVSDSLVAHGSPPVWSPDGQMAAYATEEGIVLIDRDGRREGLLDGGTRSTGDGWPHALAWSPDGRDVLALVPADGKSGSTLALLSTDLATVAHLTPATLAFGYVDRDSVSWQPSPVAGR